MSFYRETALIWPRVLLRSRLSLLTAFWLVIGVDGVWAAGLERLEISTSSGPHAFLVEVATTAEQKSSGLMHRRELPDERGMLFDFSPPQLVSMWMKDTLIPLDMIFIQADGRILRVAQETEPLSTTAIPSGGIVKAVLEVIGGTARKYGIVPGDRVRHRLFEAGR